MKLTSEKIKYKTLKEYRPMSQTNNTKPTYRSIIVSDHCLQHVFYWVNIELISTTTTEETIDWLQKEIEEISNNGMQCTPWLGPLTALYPHNDTR